jgi:metallophosphoesterase superfamily enzyme
MSALGIELAGERVLLLPQKALFWPRARMLLIADIHFGKAASFRALGIPVPRGTTTENLASLDALIASYDVQHIVFLGDFLHDRHAGDPSQLLRIDMADEPYTVGPFSFCHHPDLPAPGYVVAGHVHPVYRLSSGWESLRLPCFLLGARRAILPSFGAFTGGHVVAPQPGERIFVTAEELIFPIEIR